MHHRTLVTGSKSHKAVTKKQSRILWSYYNNSVCYKYTPYWRVGTEQYLHISERYSSSVLEMSFSLWLST